MHPLARGHLEQVEDRLALAEAVPEHRDRAEIQRARAEPDHVRHDPVELEVDHPEVLGALGHLDLEQILDGTAERHRVEVVGQVVHPLDDGDHLPVGLLLGGLLDPGVDVADDRLDVADDLALHRRQQPQHAVSGGVVGTDVERQQLVGLAHPGRLGLIGDRLLALAIGGRVERAHWSLPYPVSSLYVNSTGSPPTGKSRRWGKPSKSSGIRIRRMSGWPSNTTPNMS